jgi:hypothetical protein
MDKSEKTSESSKPFESVHSTKAIILSGIGVGLLVIFLWVANWLWIGSNYCMEQGGQFGDRFGATTSLFGGLTIVGLIVTILLQRNDLRIARDSFETQKRELKVSTDQLRLNGKEMKLQGKTMRYQRFENTFFRLLDQYHSLDKGTFRVQLEGNIQSSISPVDIRRSFPLLEQSYRRLALHVQNDLSAQIKSFESIVTYVDDNKRDDDSRQKYFRIFFSQLTAAEMWVFFYHFHLREEQLPVAFSEYAMLFDELHMTPFNQNYGQYIVLRNGVANKREQENAKQRREREEKEAKENFPAP